MVSNKNIPFIKLLFSSNNLRIICIYFPMSLDKVSSIIESSSDDFFKILSNILEDSFNNFVISLSKGSWLSFCLENIRIFSKLFLKSSSSSLIKDEVAFSLISVLVEISFFPFSKLNLYVFSSSSQYYKN